MKMRVGIYGGTFNPIHNGHLIVATKMIEILKLDKLIIMPAYIPPHKVKERRVDFFKRYEWVETAFEGVEKIEVSKFEGKKGNISYTFDTVSRFEKDYGKLVYIVGEDNFLTFDKWYRYEELLKKIELWVYPRTHKSKLLSMKKKLEKISKSIHIADEVPIIQISSTLIRERIKEGLPIRGYVPFQIEKEVSNFYR